MKKKWTIIPTNEQLDIMKEFWKKFQVGQDLYYEKIFRLEKQMSEQVGIKNLEFIHDEMCTGWAGIGNGEHTMKLLQTKELE